MSLESARLFIQKMSTNSEFANQVDQIEDVKDFYDFVAKEGYDFGTEELKKADQEFRNKVNGELSEAELSMVVGGASTMYPPCTPQSTSARCTETR